MGLSPNVDTDFRAVHEAAHIVTDPIGDAHEAIKQAIADLKAAGIAIPISLHRAAHALSYAVDRRTP